MTDNEIIKALKECEDCHYFNECEKSTRLALDLINRQKAEIQRLNFENLQMIASIKHLKSEAIKEFAERLKNSMAIKLDRKFYFPIIDNLVKEMVGDGEQAEGGR